MFGPRTGMGRVGLVALFVCATTTAAVTISTDKVTYTTIESIVVTFDGGPGNAKDWLGIYPAPTAPHSSYSEWLYVDGTKAGRIANAAGTVTFNNPGLPAGDYAFYLLENDGYAVLGGPALFTVVGVAGPTSAPSVAAPTPTPSGTISTDQATYTTIESIVVTFDGGPGNCQDWLGIYPVHRSGYSAWLYVDGTQEGITGKTAGRVTFSHTGLTPGEYAVYLLEDDGYAHLAGPALFTVVAGPTTTPNVAVPSVVPIFSIDKATYLAGETITATFISGTGNPLDWFAIYPRGAVPDTQDYIWWAYTGGVVNGDFVLPTVPLWPGDYDAHLLLDDGYSEVTPAIPFTVIMGQNKDVSGPGGGKKAIFIGIDGVRPDQLAAANTPNIDTLIANGAYDGNARTVSNTVSGPGWADLMLGVGQTKHKVTSNTYSVEWNLWPAHLSWLDRLEREDPTLNTVAVLNWEHYVSYNSPGIDVRLLTEGYSIGYDVSDEITKDKAVEVIATSDPDAMIVTFGYTDSLGHSHGSRAAKTLAGVETADRHIGEIVSAIKARSTFDKEDWLIQIGTDHGRTDGGGHGGTTESERAVFFLASGTGSAQGSTFDGATNVDHAANLLQHMLGRIDPSWELDGVPKGLAPDPSSDLTTTPEATTLVGLLCVCVALFTLL